MTAVRSVAVAAIACAGLCAQIRVAAVPFAGVSLKLSKESAPPDGFAQAKLFITEPKPISTGSTSVPFSAFDEIVGVAVMCPARDTYGIALIRASMLTVSLVSTTASYGTSADYPILTVVGHVPATTAFGSKLPLPLDAGAIQLRDPSGTLYPVDVQGGTVIVTDGVSISNVSPGSAVLSAGDVVTIEGASFTPQTQVRFGEAKLSAARYVNPGRIDVTLAQPASMHGMLVKAANPDGSRASYYSYQRTRSASPSADPVLQDAAPLLPPQQRTTGQVALPAFTFTTTTDLAVQNISGAAAQVVVELVEVNGTTIASRNLDLGTNRYIVRSTAELFGFPAAAPDVLRVRATRPVQIVGVSADSSTGTAVPIVPR